MDSDYMVLICMGKVLKKEKLNYECEWVKK